MPSDRTDPHRIRAGAVARALDLIDSLPVPEGCALVATGSLAREDMTAYSDLDLVLLHPAGTEPGEPGDVDKLWYPIWDAKFHLDHAVRTPEECAEMVAADSTAGLALLEMRHLRGDAELSERATALVRRRWREQISRNFDAVVATAATRWRRAGSVVTMTHPDLKHGRGGLRDAELLRALAMANLCDAPPLHAQRRLLLDVRTLLHAQARRRRDVLDPEFAGDIAELVGMGDRYELSAAIADAARAIDQALTVGLATARSVLARSTPRTTRRPLDLDVVESGGEIVLSRSPDLGDPALLLRVAAASARTGLPVSEHTWARLAQLPDLPEVWQPAAADDFFSLLAHPNHTGEVIDAMDRHGLWTRLVPEWDHIRGRMPRERTHIHTIDAHSLVTVAHCAAATVRVARPDLLLLGALFHDIGKGYGRPHEQVGAEFVARMARRLGLNLPDRSRVQTLVAEHTTVARLSATRDPQADETRDALLDALHYDLITVNLLEALTEADAKATGPGVWNRRLETGLRQLSTRARRALTDLSPVRPLVHAPDDLGLRANVEDETITVWWRGTYQREIIRILAVAAAKAWRIVAARLATADDGTIHLELDIRPTLQTLDEAADATALAHAYHSGVYSAVPPAEPAPTATYWNGNVLEVRTTHRPGTFATLLSALPDVTWLSARTPGATMIVQVAVSGGVDRSKVGRDVTRVLTTG